MTCPSSIATSSARHVPSPASATRSGRPVRANVYRCGGPIVQPQARHGQDVRRGGIEDERRLEVDRSNGPALGAEPARGSQLGPIETLEYPRDVFAGQSDRGAQILSITCLTTV